MRRNRGARRSSPASSSSYLFLSSSYLLLIFFLTCFLSSYCPLSTLIFSFVFFLQLSLFFLFIIQLCLVIYSVFSSIFISCYIEKDTIKKGYFVFGYLRDARFFLFGHWIVARVFGLGFVICLERSRIVYNAFGIHLGGSVRSLSLG